MSLQTFLYRRMCAGADAKRDAGLRVPADVVTRCNIRYDTDDPMQVLDIYRPKYVRGKLPVIVNFHGGGWVYGSKEIYRFYCMELARQGFAVVNPSYRLAPEHRFPAAFADMSRVFSFVLAHAEKGGFDTEHIFGIGDSSGATGMAAVACMLTNPAYAAAFPVKLPAGLRLCGVGLNCGVYSMQGRRRAMRDLLPKGGETETLKLLHIPAHITPAFPPCFLLTALGDFNREQPQKLIPRFEKYGVPYQCKIYGDEQNPLGHVFHCNIKNANANAANRAELDFFRSLL